jgi:PRC-barrel domain
MSARLEMRAMRRWPLMTLAWMLLAALAALAACATGAGGSHAGSSAPLPAPAPEAPPPQAPPPQAPPPQASAPDAPTAPEPPPLPAEAVVAPASPPACPAPQAKEPPPCVSVHRPKRAKKHKAQAPPPAQASAEPPVPAESLADKMVDAQVGELGMPLTSILGKEVKSPKGEDLGRVVDVLADAEGHVRVAIIDFGGFLGVGTRRIAVDWPLLHFNPSGDKSLIISMTRQKLQSAPEYKESNSPRVLMPPPTPDAANSGQTKN